MTIIEFKEFELREIYKRFAIPERVLNKSSVTALVAAEQFLGHQRGAASVAIIETHPAVFRE